MITNKNFHHYELINYFDVWGNEKDGYTINNQCIEFTDLIMTDDTSNKEIAEYLFKIGFLKTCDLRKIKIIDEFPYIEIYGKKQFPIASLHCIDD